MLDRQPTVNIEHTHTDTPIHTSSHTTVHTYLHTHEQMHARIKHARISVWRRVQWDRAIDATTLNTAYEKDKNRNVEPLILIRMPCMHSGCHRRKVKV